MASPAAHVMRAARRPFAKKSASPNAAIEARRSRAPGSEFAVRKNARKLRSGLVVRTTEDCRVVVVPAQPNWKSRAAVVAVTWCVETTDTVEWHVGAGQVEGSGASCSSDHSDLPGVMKSNELGSNVAG